MLADSVVLAMGLGLPLPTVLVTHCILHLPRDG